MIRGRCMEQWQANTQTQTDTHKISASHVPSLPGARRQSRVQRNSASFFFGFIPNLWKWRSCAWCTWTRWKKQTWWRKHHKLNIFVTFVNEERGRERGESGENSVRMHEGAHSHHLCTKILLHTFLSNFWLMAPICMDVLESCPTTFTETTWLAQSYSSRGQKKKKREHMNGQTKLRRVGLGTAELYDERIFLDGRLEAHCRERPLENGWGVGSADKAQCFWSAGQISAARFEPGLV